MWTSDVCLIVEGTYPYVVGGVSSWVHQIVTGLPEVRFSLVTLLADPDTPRVRRYELPPNVVEQRDVFLFGPWAEATPREPSRELVRAIEAFHAPEASRCPAFATLQRLWSSPAGASLLTARASWRMLKALYARAGHQVSFLDYFWTWRALHGPLFRLLDTPLPAAPVVHALSTGYAGFLAAIAKQRGARMALTEHGLYVLEREIEIFDSRHIGRGLPEKDRARLKDWWRRGFRFTGELAYASADRVVTLHGTNRELQIALGAAPEKVVIVPNGIHAESFAPLRRARDWRDRPFRVGLIGRVVAIKDVQTFLRAVHLARQEVLLEALVLGPLDEEPDYVAECQRLVAGWGLEKTVRFLGRVDVRAHLPELDLHVLTSVSESQPLVVLEAAAAGVPTVATDVGCCRELLEGRTPEDRALGLSGMVTPAASPEATARAIVALARDPAAHARMAEAGVTRVERFYRLDAVFDYYRELYRTLAPARTA